MKHSKLLISIVLLLLLSACGNSSFLKQKYTNLKAPSQTKEETETVDTEETAPINLSVEHPDKPSAFAPEIATEQEPNQELLSDNETVLQIEEESNSVEAITNQSETSETESHHNEFKKRRDKDKLSENIKTRRLILLCLILSYISLMVAIILFFEVLTGDVALLVGLSLLLLGLVFGGLSLLLGLKLRKIKETKRDTIWMYVGIIGGSVFMGAALINALAMLTWGFF